MKKSIQYLLCALLIITGCVISGLSTYLVMNSQPRMEEEGGFQYMCYDAGRDRRVSSEISQGAEFGHQFIEFDIQPTFDTLFFFIYSDNNSRTFLQWDCCLYDENGSALRIDYTKQMSAKLFYLDFNLAVQATKDLGVLFTIKLTFT